MAPDPIASGELFAAIGGAPAIAAVVDELYARLVADPLVRHHFDPARLDRLKAAQREWFTAALTGQPLPHDLGAAHHALEITDQQVQAVIDHLTAILTEAGVSPRQRGAVLGVVARLWQARNF